MNRTGCQVSCRTFVLACCLLTPGVSNGADPAIQLAGLFNRGLYDIVISQTTAALSQSTQPNPRLVYLRGSAEWRIGWFGAAEKDFASLGAFTPWPQWPTTSEYLGKIQAMRSLCPPLVYEVAEGRRVLFRVYYPEDNAWVRGILGLLPQAHGIGQAMFKTDLSETVVFIFNDGPSYNAFFRVLTDSSPTSWQWATGSVGVLLYCRADANGHQPAPDPNSDYFRSSIVHEYIHCLVSRAMGTIGLPCWLNEGLAMVGGSEVAPRDLLGNDQAIRRLFAAGAVMTLDELNRFFYASVANQAQKGSGKTDAYQQGFHMTRYLLSYIKPEDLPRFLNLVIEEGNLDNAFKRVFGATQADFYAAWLRHTSGMLGAG